MHLQSGVSPLFSLALATILPGLSAARFVPASKDDNHAPEPSLWPYPESEPPSEARPYWANPQWVGWCYSLCRQKAYRSDLGRDFFLELCRRDCHMGHVPYPYIGRTPSGWMAVKPRDQPQDNSDPLGDNDSTSTTGSTLDNWLQPFGDGWLSKESCHSYSEQYCSDYPWVLDGEPCLDVCRDFCELLFRKEHDWDELPDRPSLETLDDCLDWSVDYCEAYPWFLNGTPCDVLSQGWCFNDAWNGGANFPLIPPTVWPLHPKFLEDLGLFPSDEDEYQEIVDRTSTRSLTTKKHEMTSDPGRERLVRICGFICEWESILAVDLPRNEAEQCFQGCDRTCDYLRIVEFPPDSDDEYQKFHLFEDIGNSAATSPGGNEQTMTRPDDPERSVIVTACEIVCRLQWMLSLDLAVGDNNQCSETCESVCDVMRFIQLPEDILPSSAEDGSQPSEH